MNAMERLIVNLQAHEGFRARVYDDATGKPLEPGDTLVGHPTIGYGWALDVRPMSQAHATSLLRDMVQETIFEVQWMRDLDEVRQVTLYELAYNLGVSGLLGFRKMLAALKARRYEQAGMELMDSTWATQVGATRAETLRHQLVEGAWLATV
jgi:lysozyme